MERDIEKDKRSVCEISGQGARLLTYDITVQEALHRTPAVRLRIATRRYEQRNRHSARSGSRDDAPRIHDEATLSGVLMKNRKVFLHCSNFCSQHVLRVRQACGNE